MTDDLVTNIIEFPDDSGHEREQEHDRVVAPPGDPLPNAEKFVADRYSHHEHRLLVSHGGAFHAWTDTCWPEIEDAALKSELYHYFGGAKYEKEGVPVDFAPTRYKVADLLDALKAVTHLPVRVSAPAWLAGDGPAPAHELIACTNGLVHVPTRARYPLTPNLYVHHAVPFAYDADAPPPERWLRFLKELWPDDPSSIDTLQELFGYVVSGDTRQQKMFLLVGPKRAGKGTIARVLTALIGAHNVTGVTLAGMATNFGMQDLIAKPLATVSDARLRSDNSIVTERLLSVSGEDRLTVDRKYRDPWTGKLPTRFLILTNELPRLVDSSGALASRFVVLTLVKSFYNSENPELTDELVQELPGIFNWSLDGLERLRDRGHFLQPEASREAIRELEDLGSPISAFLRDRCEIGPGLSVETGELYQAWRSWCELHGRDRPGQAQMFGRDLRAAQPGLRVTQPRGDDGRYRQYEGIGLRQNHNATDRVPPRANTSETALARDGTRTQPLLSQDDQDRWPDGSPVPEHPPEDPL